jgi:cob(I)alamin adenosyltransferase
MKIYTKTGDAGDTGLFGGGRVPKSDVRVEAYGAVDELNSVIGWAMTLLDAATRARLMEIQSDLFTIGAHLATPEVTRGQRPNLPELPDARIPDMELWMDTLEAGLSELRNFILPGGAPAGASLHHARTVCRRAERRVVALHHESSIVPSIITYLNRLSDLLFVLARAVNREAGVPEHPWQPRQTDGS